MGGESAGRLRALIRQTNRLLAREPGRIAEQSRLKSAASQANVIRYLAEQQEMLRAAKNGIGAELANRRQ